MYQYKATLIKIIDGDTVDLDISLGFFTFIRVRCRLAHIDTPELHSANGLERSRARDAAAYLGTLLADPQIVIQSLRAFDGDKYGRWLVEIVNSAGVEVNKQMVAMGHAKSYEGGTKL